ncbi:MAG: DUF4190 domain-containing protein [Planctomycetes bacterium]|nr:DUF4190 domain-containing protein [Planctomycetota bacterium]
MASDPYSVEGGVHDPEARSEGDAEDQALEAMDGAALVAVVSGLGGFVFPPLGVLAIVMGLRARAIGAPHALSPPGSATAGIVLGVIDLLWGVVAVAVLGLFLVFGA